MLPGFDAQYIVLILIKGSLRRPANLGNVKIHLYVTPFLNKIQAFVLFALLWDIPNGKHDFANCYTES